MKMNPEGTHIRKNWAASLSCGNRIQKYRVEIHSGEKQRKEEVKRRVFHHIRCSRLFKYRHLCQTPVSSSTGQQRYIQRSQCKIKLSIQVHSLTGIYQQSTPPTGYQCVTVLCNNVSSFTLAGGTACSASKHTSNCSDYTMVVLSLTRRCVIGASRLSGAASVFKTQEALANPRFQCSASNSEATRGDATCLWSMHCRGHGRSCNNRVVHFDRSTRLRLHHWRWVPHLLSDDQKADRTW
jgi:hypothetical protein